VAATRRAGTTFRQLGVVLLANIRDIGFVALLDLSEDRDSASRVSLR
jgi:hypothetical protein